ncbi:hypothetical protein [Paraburkholderia sp.]|uniref:hypothetical protein n=1 Tax=Paraburkholderia sp. TaxID=1926495 RepID=UPI00239CAC6D|nr:hypothetical protein [Paraburkholderia sp.]MDE1184650.1 hypothetical protein [Paraburkholderia sp.]
MPTPKHPQPEAPKSTVPPDDIDDRLDEALDESFPASDPVAVHPHEKTPKPKATE